MTKEYSSNEIKETGENSQRKYWSPSVLFAGIIRSSPVVGIEDQDGSMALHIAQRTKNFFG